MSDKEQNGPAPEQSAGSEGQSPRDNDTPTPKKRPSHSVNLVHEDENGKAVWDRVTGAFEHRDGQGLSFNRNGERVVIRRIQRAPQERLEAKRNGEGQNQTGQGRGQDGPSR